MVNGLMLAVNPQLEILFVKIVELISTSHIEYRPYRLYFDLLHGTGGDAYETIKNTRPRSGLSRPRHFTCWRC